MVHMRKYKYNQTKVATLDGKVHIHHILLSGFEVCMWAFGMILQISRSCLFARQSQAKQGTTIIVLTIIIDSDLIFNVVQCLSTLLLF